MLRRVVAVLALALMATLAPRRASACSCVPPRLQRTVLPADGATDFPIDGVIRVFLTGGFPAPLRSAIASEYRLRGADGALVPLSSTVVGTRLDLRPTSPLAPGQRYRLESVFAFDGAGVRVSDTERLIATARDATSELRGAWFPVAQLETASTPSSARTAAPQLGSAGVFYRHGGGDCGPGMALHTELTLPPTIRATDVVELRADGAVIETLPALGTRTAYVGDLLCDPDPVTLPARSLDVELVVLDAAGRELGTSGRVRARSGSRPSREWQSRRRSTAPTAEEQAIASRWVALRVVRARATAEPGPVACAYGLEQVAQREVASSGGPWIYEAESTLSSDGQRAWLGLADPAGSTRAVRVAPDGSATTLAHTLAGLPMSTGAGARGPLFVTGTYREGTLEVSLSALGADGAPRFTQRVDGASGYLRVASGSSRALVSFVHDEQVLVRRVAWAMFDEAGAPVGATHVSAHRAHDGGVASAFVRDHFLLAWPSGSARTISIATIGLDGAELASRDLGVRGEGPLDLASTGAEVALVTQNEGQIEWRLLDASGTVVRGPVIVSAGVGGRDNRKPRIAWNGEVFAVAWETNPSNRTYVSVIDPAGHVGPALALDPDHHTSTVGIAAVGRGFVGSHTLDPYDPARVIVSALRCRASAPSGAPQRIAR